MGLAWWPVAVMLEFGSVMLEFEGDMLKFGGVMLELELVMAQSDGVMLILGLFIYLDRGVFGKRRWFVKCIWREKQLY